MAGSSADIDSRLAEITKCPICFEEFNQPKSLPCLHTYCLQCLLKHFEYKQVGDEVPCPECRREFEIPAGGLSNLPSDFKMQSWVDLQKMQISATGGTCCQKHAGKPLELFCFTCSTNICMKCFAVGHQGHTCREIEEVAVDLLKRVDKDIASTQSQLDEVQKRAKQLQTIKREFLDKVGKAQQSIKEKADEMKKMIDGHAAKLQDELQAVKDDVVCEIAGQEAKLELEVRSLSSLREHCEQFRATSKPSDITRSADSLHANTVQQLSTAVSFDDFCAPYLPFITTSFTDLTKEGNFLGHLETDHNMTVPRVVHTFPESQSVCGVTSLDNELFVLRNKAEDEIEVYNTTTNSLLRQLTVPGLEGVSDMTSCRHTRCLYISDGTSTCIHRVELHGSTTNWPVNDEPCYLSITAQFTVLFTCCVARKLKEFSTRGEQLREIILQPDIVNPWHAIQLSNRQFVVCHGNAADPVNRVCIVDTNGRVVQSYGEPRGSATVGQLNGPLHLAVDKDEFVSVVDRDNRRVLLLSPTLRYVREIVSSDQLNWDPRRLCLDADRRLLYVAESELKEGKYTAGQVIVVSV